MVLCVIEAIIVFPGVEWKACLAGVYLRSGGYKEF